MFQPGPHSGRSGDDQHHNPLWHASTGQFRNLCVCFIHVKFGHIYLRLCIPKNKTLLWWGKKTHVELAVWFETMHQTRWQNWEKSSLFRATQGLNGFHLCVQVNCQSPVLVPSLHSSLLLKAAQSLDQHYKHVPLNNHHLKWTLQSKLQKPSCNIYFSSLKIPRGKKEVGMGKGPFLSSEHSV